MEFNSEYLKRMEEMLGSSYPAFFESMQDNRTYGLRFNALKVSDDMLDGVKTDLGMELEPIPWEMRGYYYDGELCQPGKDVLHDIGAYYIQEPSAQSVVSKLELEEGDLVLDLCAAPGGKSTQILSCLSGSGFLVSNEIVRDRALILASNIERMGAKNSAVLNEDPDSLSSAFPMTFDKILIDSPCSGEGMFRKNPEAIEQWSVENVETCIKRDDDILNAAAVMLKSGGRIVYSTCTFEYGENEGAIERFLSSHEGFECVEKKRLYPHEVKGEGHFYAVLESKGESKGKSLNCTAGGFGKKFIQKLPDEYVSFVKENLRDKEEYLSNIIQNKDQLVLVNITTPNLSDVHIIRAGLSLGVLKKNRFEPGHTLAMSLKATDVINSYECSREEITKYLKGETLNCGPSIKGWTLITYKGISAGWAKASGGVLKNHYPKGLRRYS